MYAKLWYALRNLLISSNQQNCYDEQAERSQNLFFNSIRIYQNPLIMLMNSSKNVLMSSIKISLIENKLYYYGSSSTAMHKLILYCAIQSALLSVPLSFKFNSSKKTLSFRFKLVKIKTLSSRNMIAIPQSKRRKKKFLVWWHRQTICETLSQ